VFSVFSVLSIFQRLDPLYTLVYQFGGHGFSRIQLIIFSTVDFAEHDLPHLGRWNRSHTISATSSSQASADSDVDTSLRVAVQVLDAGLGENFMWAHRPIVAEAVLDYDWVGTID
jgi:hypothetical protein